jgi:hypothetical protein
LASGLDGARRPHGGGAGECHLIGFGSASANCGGAVEVVGGCGGN